MKRLLAYISALAIIGLCTTFKLNCPALSLDNTNISTILDKQQSDFNYFFDRASSNKSTMPEIYNGIPSPSARTISYQRKNQNNIISSMIIRHFAFSLVSTKKYNTIYSFTLSTNDNFIIILRHLII